MAINELRAINEQFVQLEVFLHPTLEYVYKLNSEELDEYAKKIHDAINIKKKRKSFFVTQYLEKR
ncbi:MAG: hypothetical protein MUF87_17465 [Anaerolineae bacterium]|nr:hypothetical protein [Anaerolineae bacterium]